MRSDQEWIHQLKEQDENAIQDLWNHIYKIAIVSVRKRMADNDIASSATFAAYERVIKSGIWNYDFRAPFINYCSKITVNEVNRILRKLGPPQKSLEEVSHDQSMQYYDQASVVSSEELKQRIAPCFDKLTSREKEVLSLYYFEDRNQFFITEQLNISQSNLHAILSRSRRKLRKCLEHHGYSSVEDLMRLL